MKTRRQRPRWKSAQHFPPAVAMKVPPRPGREAAASVGGGAQSSDRAATILLVEDESSVRRTLGDFLRRLGYRVLEADNGSEGLALASRNKGPLHLLLADVVMPGMSGGELAQRLKLLRPKVRVLYISGRISQGQLLDPRIPFLHKPFRLEELAEKVRQVLGRPERG